MTTGVLGQTSDGPTTFWNAGDVSGQRSLNTDFVAGARRRHILASVICSAVVAGQALVGYITVLAGTTLTIPDYAGFAAGVILAGRFALEFFCDPGGTYRVTTTVGAGASVTLNKWIEADF